MKVLDQKRLWMLTLLSVVAALTNDILKINSQQIVFGGRVGGALNLF